MNPIRVLIVEDSPVACEHLRRIIAADGRFQIVGAAATGEEAVELVGRLAPDVISMDIHLPGMQGFEATRRIMASHPTPIVIVSSTDMNEVDLAMAAFKAGALAVVEKPVSAAHPAYQVMAERLCTQLAIMSEVKVVRQRDLGRIRRASADCFEGNLRRWRVLAIAASTGGPNALLELLSGLGRDFPLPVVVVQHMTPAFMDGFARWLSGLTAMPARLVVEPVLLAPGTIYLPGRESHLVVTGESAALDWSPPLHCHRPAADLLFSSVARRFGASSIGVVLTGMGGDGAAGLAEIKTAGGYTIAEAESTAVVYGMPGAAVAMGGVCESLPVHDIAARILELVSRKEAG